MLAAPVYGQHFHPFGANACRTCAAVVAATPLEFGISPSNELSRLRAVIVETSERRLEPAEAVDWLVASMPTVPPAIGRAA